MTFSEPMANPVGDTDPEDVTNPANYQLVATGPDHDLDTTACDIVVGDDVAVVAESVSFDAASFTATVELHA